MKISDLFLMCLKSLWRRKVRSVLTIFGVVIGTCSIVVMLSLGLGIKQSEMSWIEDMGDLTIITVYQNWENQDLKLDAKAVEDFKALDGVEGATAFTYVDCWSSMNLHVDEKYLYEGNIIAVDFDALPGLGYTVSEGHMPKSSESDGVLLFGNKAAYQFCNIKRKHNNYVDSFPDENGVVKDPFVNPMKDKMSINIVDSEKYEYHKIPDKVFDDKIRAAGILASDESSNYQFDKEYTIYIDLTYAKKITDAFNKENKLKVSNDESYNQVYVKAKSVEDVEKVEKAIEEIGYEVSSMSSMRESIEEEMMTIELILGGLGAISMLVAALSITNTMVMSIYERTKEIGIMKVLGCKIGDIRMQFLVEAGLIGFIGGVLGIILSFVLSKILNLVLGGSGALGYGNTISIIPIWLVLLGLGFATVVGLVAGFSPANRAVKTSALEAIKHE